MVVIGYGIWKNRYAADPRVLGRTLRVNGRPVTIIGVMPEGMKFPDTAELWTPLIESAQPSPNARTLRVFGRLRDDTTRREAYAELSGIGQQLLTASPETTQDSSASAWRRSQNGSSEGTDGRCF